MEQVRRWPRSRVAFGGLLLVGALALVLGVAAAAGEFDDGPSHELAETASGPSVEAGGGTSFPDPSASPGVLRAQQGACGYPGDCKPVFCEITATPTYDEPFVLTLTEVAVPAVIEFTVSGCSPAFTRWTRTVGSDPGSFGSAGSTTSTQTGFICTFSIDGQLLAVDHQEYSVDALDADDAVISTSMFTIEMPAQRCGPAPA